MTTPRSPEWRAAFMLACITALLAIALAMWFVSTVRAEPAASRSLYDGQGRFTGSAIKHGNGSSFYGGRGRFIGSSTNTGPRR
jgi:hypothetical protein